MHFRIRSSEYEITSQGEFCNEENSFQLYTFTFVIGFAGSFSFKAESRGANLEDKIKGENKTGCIEVLEAKRSAEGCTANQGISFRLKVNCEKPVDVRVYYKGKKGWLANTFLNKKSGEEISFSTCDAKDSYVVYERDAGSNTDFPVPKP